MRRSAFYYLRKVLFLDICNSHYVGKNSGGCNASSCSITLNKHWVLLVTLCGKQYDIVTAFKVVEWVVLIDLAQRYASLAILVFSNETPVFSFGGKQFTFLFEMCVELG